MSEKTTAQVAEQLGINKQSLIVFLARHPDLKPVKRMEPFDYFLWTAEEIERLKEAKASAKIGRPKKQ